MPKMARLERVNVVSTRKYIDRKDGIYIKIHVTVGNQTDHS